jgi:glycosylphosphatidylinositol transamidase
MIMIQYGISVTVSIISTLVSIIYTQDSPEHDGTILKSFILAQSALVIATVSLLNFTLGVATAILILIPYSLIGPSTTNLFTKMLQLVVLILLSPIGLASLFSYMTEIQLTDILATILSDYHIVRSWFLTYICTVYWPINMAMIILVFSKSST